MTVSEVRILSVPGMPIIVPGDDLAALIRQAAEDAALDLQDGDIVVVTQKIVSKAEGCLVSLAEVIALAAGRDVRRAMGQGRPAGGGGAAGVAAHRQDGPRGHHCRDASRLHLRQRRCGPFQHGGRRRGRRAAAWTRTPRRASFATACGSRRAWTWRSSFRIPSGGPGARGW